MIDLQEFWDSFNSESESVQEQINVSLNTHPYVCVGAFYRTVLEGSLLSHTYLSILPQPEDRKDFLKKVKLYLLEKAFNNLEYLDYSNEIHILQIQKHPADKIKQTIDICIEVFEGREEYEKCAELKKLESVL